MSFDPNTKHNIGLTSNFSSAGDEAAAAIAAQTAEGAQTHQLQPKAAVVVHGLRNGTQHNGKTGHVQGFDATARRYTVALDEGTPQLIKVKPARSAPNPRPALCGAHSKRHRSIPRHSIAAVRGVKSSLRAYGRRKGG